MTTDTTADRDPDLPADPGTGTKPGADADRDAVAPADADGRADAGGQAGRAGAPVGAGRTAVVVIASTRAADGVYPDRTGPVIRDWLAARSFSVGDPQVVADGPAVGAALRTALGASLILTSGGTGLSPTDGTPQATAQVLDVQIPGLADAIRRAGSDAVPTAVLSRGLAGVAGRTLIVNLPGSTGGVRDGLAVLDGVLGHALDQIAGGGDHRPGGGIA